MSKKLITACLGLVALAAFALPAVASAANDPQLTEPTGTLVTGTPNLLATNVGNTVLKDGEGKNTLTECSTARLTGTLTKNSGGTVEGNITTATFSGTGLAYKGMNECTGISVLPNLTVTTNGTHEGKKVDEEDVENGTPYCLRSTPLMAEDEFQVRGGTCSETPARKITFIFHTTPFFAGDKERECKYERTEAIKGTYTTDVTGDALMTLTAGPNTKFTGEAGNNVLCPGSGTLQMTFTMETDIEPATPMFIS